MELLENSLKFSILFFIFFLSFSMALSNFFLYFSFVLSIIVWYKKKKLPETHGLFLPYLLLMFWIGITHLWSPSTISLFKNLKFGHYLIFLVLIDLNFEYSFFKKTLIIFLITNSSILFMAILSSYLPQNLPFIGRLSEWAIRYKGCFTNPIAYGEFLVMIVLATLVYIFYMEKNNIHRAILSGLTLILIFAIILTGSRAVWLGFFFSIMILFHFLLKTKKKIFFLGFVSIFFILILTTPLGNIKYFKKITNKIYNSITKRKSNGRDLIFKIGINMIKDNPILGGGEGFVKNNFLNYKRKLGINGRIKEKYWLVLESGTHLHDNYLQFWAEGGIIQLILFFWLIYIMLKKVEAGFTSDRCNNPYFLVILLIIVSYLISGIFEYNFFYSNVSRLFWLFMGILYKLGFSFEENKKREIEKNDNFLEKKI